MAEQANTTAARLYGIPGSHSVRTAELMLDYKQLVHERINYPAGAHWDQIPRLGFRFGTVPALDLEGRLIQGTRRIARVLDEFRATPPLLPADAEARKAVLDIERWGEQVLQPLARRIVLAAGARDPGELTGQGDGGLLGALLAADPQLRRAIFLNGWHIWGGAEEIEQQDLASLPGLLDRIDSWLRQGLLGRDEPNAADFQLAPSVALLMYRLDLQGALAPRPAYEFAQRLLSGDG